MPWAIRGLLLAVDLPNESARIVAAYCDAALQYDRTEGC
jgi:hypothetical protein